MGLRRGRHWWHRPRRRGRRGPWPDTWSPTWTRLHRPGAHGRKLSWSRGGILAYAVRSWGMRLTDGGRRPPVDKPADWRASSAMMSRWMNVWRVWLSAWVVSCARLICGRWPMGITIFVGWSLWASSSACARPPMCSGSCGAMPPQRRGSRYELGQCSGREPTTTIGVEVRAPRAPLADE